MKTYSIGEVAALMELPVSTLRYYDKEGLLETVERTSGGVRIFKEEDIRHLRMLECLKGTGMQLKDIKTFFEWCKEGDSTLEKRYNLFLERKAEIERQMDVLRDMMDVINYKCEYYKTALDAGTIHIPQLVQLRHEAVNDSDYVRKIVGED